LRIIRQLRHIPFSQQFVDPRSGRFKLEGSKFEIVVVSGASLNELEEFLGILVFDQVSECVERATARKKRSQPVEIRNALDFLPCEAVLRGYPRVYTALL
jgi:hypothetical protein